MTPTTQKIAAASAAVVVGGAIVAMSLIGSGSSTSTVTSTTSKTTTTVKVSTTLGPPSAPVMNPAYAYCPQTLKWNPAQPGTYPIKNYYITIDGKYVAMTPATTYTRDVNVPQGTHVYGVQALDTSNRKGPMAKTTTVC